ncbi:MAG: excinuclease ABC subunit UvrC [Lachnospiraceae bacterium]|nr:excinuclease ABC subunit UvrC [Lachnospiraceae bacterium]
MPQIPFDGEALAKLRAKANALPLTPGVYLMKDRGGHIIYVGKSKALKNRVSSYFQDVTAHNYKTQKMVSLVRDFDYMLTDTEMEALSLENRLIKLHTPKFNIRLKDDKSYPYLKVTLGDEYPRILVTRRRLADGAKYFGPYFGISSAYAILRTAEKAFLLPSCKKSFPKDIGKGRPCLNYQLGLCSGVCTGKITKEEYRDSFREVVSFLRGDFGEVKESLTEKMNYAAENLMFEAAAVYRDRLNAISGLWQRQKVIASPDVEHDVFALYSDEIGTCLTGFFVRGGAIVDSENWYFGADQIADSASLTAFLCDLYEKREYVPKELLLGFPLDAEDRDALAAFLRERCGSRVTLLFPERGEKKALTAMVAGNAKEKAAACRRDAEKDSAALVRLSVLLGLEVVPERIEAYDISNLGNENITAGKVTLVNGKFSKKDYRLYKIAGTGTQDDYASMTEAVRRRFSHPEDPFPDLLLLDGGNQHVSVIRSLLGELGIDIPVFGMVKDEFHKTRAIASGDGEISIAKEQTVFVMVYRLQEEVHRYTVSHMNAAKRKTLRTSSLEKIDGIGPAKAKALLAHFRSVSAVKEATEEELAAVKGISEKDAAAVAAWFAGEKTGAERNEPK